MSVFVDAVANFADLTPLEKDLLNKTLDDCQPLFREIDEITGANQIKVLEAFQEAQVGDFHLNGSTGYGYGDSGREVLEDVWANVFHAERALVRGHIVSGTHAIALALFGNLDAGDTMLSVSGMPYDTLQTIIGKGREPEPGTLAHFGVRHEVVPLKDGKLDENAIKKAIQTLKPKMVAVQRSRGYDWRDSLYIEEIQSVCEWVKELSPESIVFVDNCYGEFVENQEPLEVGADLIAGSLIKNPGGGIAPRGGYVAGREDLVERSARRLTAPGISHDVGSALDFNRPAFQGLFMAPLIVGQALKGAIFAAAWLESFGYRVSPRKDEKRADIIQAIEFGDADRLRKFCRGIQSASPLESYVTPYDSPLPGYDDAVIMAGGTFTQGSSIELSIDGPMRSPYIGYMQGGLALSHVVASVCKATRKMEE